MTVFIVASMLSSLLCSVLYAPFRQIIQRFAPSTRSLAALGFAAITPAVGLLTVLLNALPGHAQFVVLQHCHGAYCGPHAPEVVAATIGSICLIVVAALLGLGLVSWVVRRVVGVGRRLTAVFALSKPSSQHRYLVIDSDQPFAWCCGLLKQRIVISQALLSLMNAAQLEWVLAHEVAHAQRYDNLRNLAAGWMTWLWPRRQRYAMLSDMAADSERACDNTAQQEIGEPLLSRQLMDLTAAVPQTLQPAAKRQFAAQPISQRSALASVQTHLHPSAAYALVAAFWCLQLALVAAACHPLLEAIAAFKL